MSEGAKRIVAERKRQITVERWTPEHDDEHVDGEMALVAALYATPVPLYARDQSPRGSVTFADPWPLAWDDEWDKRPRRESSGALRKPTRAERIRMLEKAGALIAAEIDRLLRASGIDESKGAGR